jgi:uncharacterized protein (DUF2062 family)
MPRRFFTQLSRRYDHKKENQWYLRPFNYILAHPMYFATTRRGVSSGLWLGLFIGLLPIPGQTMIAVLGAIALRLNVPVAAIAVWISNPLTFVPIFYLSYKLGATLLNIPAEAFPDEFTWEWLSSKLAVRWEPLFYGSFIIASSVASTAYVIVNLVWQIMTMKRYRLRRQHRSWNKLATPKNSK